MLGLSWYVVCFVIDLPRPRVKIADIAPIPDGRWMLQVARNLMDGLDDYLLKVVSAGRPGPRGDEVHYRSMSRGEVP